VSLWKKTRQSTFYPPVDRWMSTLLGPSSTADTWAVARLVGVDELPDGCQIAPQLLVLLGLAVDLVARVKNR
jgi:hypothetical protein